MRLGPAAGGHDAQYDVKLVQEMEAAVLGTASSQAAVYKASAHGIAGQLLKGCSGCWIACGPPQSGKTYSTVGHLGEYARMGVVPRLASDILESLAAKPDLVLRMSCARWSGAVLVQDLLAIGRPAAHTCRPLPAVPAKPRGKGGLSQGQGLVKEEVTVLSEVLLMLERATRAIAAGVKAPDPLDQSSVVILLSLWHKPRARGREGQLHASVACVDMASQESLRETLEIWAGGESGERPGQASVVVAVGGGEASRRARPSVRSLLQTCRLFVAGNMGECAEEVQGDDRQGVAGADGGSGEERGATSDEEDHEPGTEVNTTGLGSAVSPCRAQRLPSGSFPRCGRPAGSQHSDDACARPGPRCSSFSPRKARRARPAGVCSRAVESSLSVVVSDTVAGLTRDDMPPGAQACPLPQKVTQGDEAGVEAGLTRDDMLDVLEEYLERIVALEALVAELATSDFKVLRSAHAGGGEGDQVWEEVSVAALLPPGVPRAGAAPAAAKPAGCSSSHAAAMAAGPVSEPTTGLCVAWQGIEHVEMAEEAWRQLREGEEALGQGRALVESQAALVRQLVAQVRVGEQALAVKERELDDSLARQAEAAGALEAKQGEVDALSAEVAELKATLPLEAAEELIRAVSSQEGELGRLRAEAAAAGAARAEAERREAEERAGQQAAIAETRRLVHLAVAVCGCGCGCGCGCMQACMHVFYVCMYV